MGNKTEQAGREAQPVSLKEARESLGDLVDEAVYEDRIIPLTRRGREIGAVIGRRDVERLRAVRMKSKG